MWVILHRLQKDNRLKVDRQRETEQPVLSIRKQSAAQILSSSTSNVYLMV